MGPQERVLIRCSQPVDARAVPSRQPQPGGIRWAPFHGLASNRPSRWEPYPEWDFLAEQPSTFPSDQLVATAPGSCPPPLDLRILEGIAHVSQGVFTPFPGQVQKTVPMEVKAQVVTARLAGLDAVTE